MNQQDLTVVGLTPDKQKLVLVSPAGEEFTLPVDQKLRAALRGEGTRLGQLETTMESTLRPRDIQARIRAGETPESVAAAAQTTLERVMSYATPVLAERAHITERAQRASLRRKAGEAPARLLGDAVSDQLRSRNVDPALVDWDAWRREDGRWTLVADLRAGDGRAEFVFDAPGRYVMPENDAARRLVGELPATEARRPGSSRRLSAVGLDEELPLGEDAIGMVTGEGDGADDEPTLDLSGTARRVREVPAAEPAGETGDADWMATQATERPRRPVAAPAPPEAQPDQAEAEPDRTAVEPDRTAVEPDRTAVDGRLTETASTETAAATAEAEAADAEVAEEPEPKQPARRPVKKNKGRASVPSWDEIMFGGGRSE